MSLLRRSARPERNLFTVHETRPTPKSLGRVACLMALALLFVGVRQVQAGTIGFDVCSFEASHTFGEPVQTALCTATSNDPFNVAIDIGSFAIDLNLFFDDSTKVFRIGPESVKPNGESTILWTTGPISQTGRNAVVTLTTAAMSQFDTFDLLSADLGAVRDDNIFKNGGTPADAIVVKGFVRGMADPDDPFSMVTIRLDESLARANQYIFQTVPFDPFPGPPSPWLHRLSKT
jgi:hypothetical protein